VTGAAGMALVSVTLAGPVGSGGDAIGLAAASDPLSGVNMSLFGANDTLMTQPATQGLFKQWGIPMVRVPLRDACDPNDPGTKLNDAIWTKAMEAARATGATPVVIIRGPA
jgi:hypothetical protein